ncbi:cytochrome b5 domain-containing protein [Candidatus Dojkabacteria bacterium]|uniref:Cytochrome b5 domain-containing protein n=1 Tax=Candidatus Dojkabacteria bacterium TaxID=2099670 RepID=A0A955I996_9BACT|nr:cytochrome b5 domain-containing protein [Candidatus Dojkabacteria bacterium]
MKALKLTAVAALSLLLVGCTATPSSAPTNSSTDTSTSQTYTAAEVAAHSSSSDCWMIVDGGVYDVTDYVRSHPGGSAILSGCGKDASSYFRGQASGGGERHTHSSAAEQILGQYKIGVEG